MADLFAQEPSAPLAEALRPRTLDEVIGQSHLLGEGKPLRLAFQSGKPHSMIFWGPPGVGKTTLARLTATAFRCEFIALSAVFSGVKDIRAAMEQAQQNLAMGKHTILFVDEIHRFNKSQQDALLPYAESGLVTFIGATTENPSFEVNSALLSRAQVYVLKSLTDEELQQLLQRARDKALGGLEFDDVARDTLIGYADGDARRFLNLLEQCQTAAGAAGVTRIDAEFVQNALTLNSRRFDKGGDNFYDQISALHKSVRGSHPDAALYWLTRMLDGGADPRYLSRRIVRMAWEDIGLADPRALQIANDAALTYERLGSPEGELALGQAVIYLAVAAKSNAGYNAYNQARAFVKRDKSREGSRPPAQRADQADEGAGLRARVPLCPRRAQRLRRGRDLPARRHGRAPLVPASPPRPGGQDRREAGPAEALGRRGGRVVRPSWARAPKRRRHHAGTHRDAFKS
ncbi:putative ATPase [Paracidovorax wautersii]|uniref:Replication-associated recombination protein A n=1 Tax=Paracidovorax wautersii TaxID=1177982 RepID=A0ABU1ID89_9BURK|nr:putative ATPase [Paracidovorax wautersii]